MFGFPGGLCSAKKERAKHMIPVARSKANTGRRRAAKGPSASDDELLEAAMAQAQAERDGIGASKAGVLDVTEQLD